MDKIDQQLFTYIQNNDDYKKCNEYIEKIQNGDYTVLQEANLFVFQKYDEFCRDDMDLVKALGIVKVSNIAINNNFQFSTLGGLDSIQRLIIGKFVKKMDKDNSMK